MSKNQSRNRAENEGGGTGRNWGADLLRLAVPAGILALLAVSFWNQRSIERVQTSLDSRLEQIEKGLGEVAGKVETAAARVQPAPRRGPDPNRVYPINTVGSPVKGPPGAPITIAEFSDFQ